MLDDGDDDDDDDDVGVDRHIDSLDRDVGSVLLMSNFPWFIYKNIVDTFLHFAFVVLDDEITRLLVAV